MVVRVGREKIREEGMRGADRIVLLRVQLIVLDLETVGPRLLVQIHEHLLLELVLTV